MSKRITIDPITRLEGHGKIEIFLDDAGNVERAFFQVPELRGFETFCIGRPAEARTVESGAVKTVGQESCRCCAARLAESGGSDCFKRCTDRTLCFRIWGEGEIDSEETKAMIACAGVGDSA